MRILTRLVVLPILASSCTDASAPAAPRADVAVESSVLTVTLGNSGDRLRVTVPVAIHNSGSSVLYYDTCWFAIEGQAGDTWETVWRPICNLDLRAPSEIAPGATVRIPLQVWAALGGRAGPGWQREQIEGTYRVVAPLGAAIDGGSILLLNSNPFTLIVDE